MTALAATDLSYTILNQTISNLSIKKNQVSITFGDGALTYPSGGIAFTGGKLGMPNSIRSLKFLDLGTSGYTPSWDSTNGKLRLFQSASHTHSLFLKNADQTDAANNRVNAAAGKLGANTGSDITIAGVANTAASGGIVNVAAGALAELATTVAPSAMTLVVEVEGY